MNDRRMYFQKILCVLKVMRESGIVHVPMTHILGKANTNVGSWKQMSQFLLERNAIRRVERTKYILEPYGIELMERLEGIEQELRKEGFV